LAPAFYLATVIQRQHSSWWLPPRYYVVFGRLLWRI